MSIKIKHEIFFVGYLEKYRTFNKVGYLPTGSDRFLLNRFQKKKGKKKGNIEIVP